MDATEIAKIARETIETALREEDQRRQEVATATAARQAEIDSAVKDALNLQARQFAKTRRLPTADAGEPQNGQAPYVRQFADTDKYAHLSVEDQAFLCGVLDGARRDHKSQGGVSESALKALAIKIAEDKSALGEESRRDLKAAGLPPEDVVNAAKANELDYSTQSGYGDEWVGVEYSRRLWERIRFGAMVANRFPSVEVPQGSESILIPLEAADPTWYKVAQTTATNGTTGIPDSSVTASKVATDNKSLTVAKMGARTVWAAELEEDSLIPWVSQLRTQLEKSGSENLDAVVIDGDTDASATTNINHIAGTPGGTENYLTLNGLRKLALVTNTANSRSAGGALADTDFIETLRLMGVAGLNASDQNAVSFLVDANVNWAILQITSVKTRDVFLNATLENGLLRQVWGYKVDAAPFMHSAYNIATSVRKVNTAGKVDQSSSGANNTTGAILAVRWDQWLLGYKRRMTIKIQEIINSDASQIVAFVRVGLAARDSEAAAVSYNVGI